MFDRLWEVTIWRGRPMSEDGSEAPLKFGTPTVAVGENGDLGEVEEPLIYGPVILRGDTSDLRIQVPAQSDEALMVQLQTAGHMTTSYKDVRVMARPMFEIEWSGTLRFTGFEYGPEGQMFEACWMVEPYTFPEVESLNDALLERDRAAYLLGELLEGRQRDMAEAFLGGDLFGLGRSSSGE